MTLTTAAAAVVLQPLESSMTETRSGSKNEPTASRRIASPLATSMPPMNTAVFLRSAGPRVNMAP